MRGVFQGVQVQNLQEGDMSDVAISGVDAKVQLFLTKSGNIHLRGVKNGNHWKHHYCRAHGLDNVVTSLARAYFGVAQI